MVRRLVIRIETAEGLYGADIPFKSGLNIIRADNTSGKSTCLLAILYALGLEGMLGPRHEIPLPPAVTDRLEGEDGKELLVLRSEVLLEIENHLGYVMTVRRPVAGGENENIHLISTWGGSVLSNPKPSLSRVDYFVRRRGAAVREAGFHTRLASFLGWDLPSVPTFSGVLVPLYLEAIFPLMFIEQKRGWSSVHSRFPTHLGIREIARRATEFVLELDAYRIELKRGELKQREDEIVFKWNSTVTRGSAFGNSLGGKVSGIPESPVSAWPPAVAPEVLAAQGGNWVPVEAALSQITQELTALERRQIPTAQEDLELVEETLAREEERLSEIEYASSQILEELDLGKAQETETQERLQAVEEDLRQNQDALTLKELGSVQELEVNSGRCPTCHQEVVDSLIPQSLLQEPMNLSENIAFLKEQQKIFRSLRLRTEEETAGKQAQLEALRRAASESRSRIRALKETLVSPSDSPSVAAIEARFRLREKADNLTRLKRIADETYAALSGLTDRWRQVQEEKKSLPKGSLSDRDEEKLKLLESVVVAQLRRYGFGSIDPSEVAVSPETYQLMHKGSGGDLQFEISASDVIRCLWAYTLGLLEVAREFENHHAGLLIVDEPGQQEVAADSLIEFFRRAASAAKHEQQVIIATSSEEQAALKSLSDMPINYLSFQGRIIRKT